MLDAGFNGTAVMTILMSLKASKRFRSHSLSVSKWDLWEDILHRLPPIVHRLPRRLVGSSSWIFEDLLDGTECPLWFIRRGFRYPVLALSTSH